MSCNRRQSNKVLSLDTCAVQDKVRIDYRPVHDQPMDSEMEHVPPKARTY